MSIVENQLVSIPSAGKAKMEDRKRPATQSSSEESPPRKKHATTVNGENTADPDADMPWKGDLEVRLQPGQYNPSCTNALQTLD